MRRPEEIAAELEAFGFWQKNDEQRIELIERLFGVMVIPEELIRNVTETYIDHDGETRLRTICNINMLAELIDARIDLAPIPMRVMTRRLETQV